MSLSVDMPSYFDYVTNAIFLTSLITVAPEMGAIFTGTNKHTPSEDIAWAFSKLDMQRLQETWIRLHLISNMEAFYGFIMFCFIFYI